MSAHDTITLRRDALPELVQEIRFIAAGGCAPAEAFGRIESAIIAAGVPCGAECPQGGPHEDACPRLAATNPPDSSMWCTNCGQARELCEEQRRRDTFCCHGCTHLWGLPPPLPDSAGTHERRAWQRGDVAIAPEGERVELVRRIHRVADDGWNWIVQIPGDDRSRWQVYEGNLAPIPDAPKPPGWQRDHAADALPYVTAGFASPMPADPKPAAAQPHNHALCVALPPQTCDAMKKTASPLNEPASCGLCPDTALVEKPLGEHFGESTDGGDHD